MSCIASFGAVNGLASGVDWYLHGTDRGDVTYAGVWEAWKSQVPQSLCPTPESVTNANSAGNAIEAVMGVAWLRVHEERLAGVKSFSCMLHAERLGYFNDAVTSAFLLKARRAGEALWRWVPVLERAILTYAGICVRAPELHCTRRTYDATLQYARLEAVRFGRPLSERRSNSCPA